MNSKRSTTASNPAVNKQKQLKVQPSRSKHGDSAAESKPQIVSSSKRGGDKENRSLKAKLVEEMPPKIPKRQISKFTLHEEKKPKEVAFRQYPDSRTHVPMNSSDSNITPEQVDVLLSICQPFENIISGGHDVSQKEKELIWKKIMRSYNAATGDLLRNTAILRDLYESLQHDVHKKDSGLCSSPSKIKSDEDPLSSKLAKLRIEVMEMEKQLKEKQMGYEKAEHQMRMSLMRNNEKRNAEVHRLVLREKGVAADKKQPWPQSENA